jgi:hypothetical protein
MHEPGTRVVGLEGDDYVAAGRQVDRVAADGVGGVECDGGFIVGGRSLAGEKEKVVTYRCSVSIFFF